MSNLLIETRGDTLWLTINRPEQRNTLNRALIELLIEALDEATASPKVRAVVLTAAGARVFCAGADLKETSEGDQGGLFAQSGTSNPLVMLYQAMRRCRKIIIGRIGGAAVGGGLGVVAGCDLAYAAQSARFGMPEVKVGLFPMMIASYLLRQLPRRRFQELAYLGELITADEAERYGIINRVVPDTKLDATIEDILSRLRNAGPEALQAGKTAIDTMQDLTLDHALLYGELHITKLNATAEAAEGILAFVEKRLPYWAQP